MKKVLILTLLMAISLIGLSQTSDNDFNQLVKKTSQYYDFKGLASDSTTRFQLEEVRSQVLVNKTTRTKTPQYKLVFKKLSDGSKHSLFTASPQHALSALNETTSMIIYDGDKLTLIPKK